MKDLNTITIFTDGSSRGNPGQGGWGAVIIAREQGARSKRFPKSSWGEQGKAKIIELGGAEKNTTNNRMEIMAAIQALRKIQDTRPKIQKGGIITIYTDSSYVINGITKWIKGWKKNGWRTKAKEDVLNKDLWMKLDECIADIEFADGKVAWKYVGGHVGILGNERCDHIATAFADGMKIKLFDGPIADYDLPDILDVSLDEAKHSKKASGSAHSRAKAYSYVSMLDGVIEVHHSWAECEKRVKGARGAKYKKALDAAGEAKLIEEFGTI